MVFSFKTFSQSNDTSQPGRQPTQNTYPFPTPIISQWTENIHQWSALTNNGDPGVLALEPSFAQLRQTYAQEQYINNLGKFKSDDPKRQSRLALANLRENRTARRDLPALHAARSHLYGERELGYKSGTPTKLALPGD